MKTSASERPPSAAMSSAKTTSSSLWRELRNQRQSLWSAAVLVDLAQAAPERDALGGDAEDQDADRDPGVLDRLGRLQLVHALVDREQAAHAEQHQGDDEAPEVDRLAVAERMVAARAAPPSRMPQSRSPWLAQSAYEWIASASIDDEPVKIAPPVLASAIRKFAPSANRIDLSESAPADMARLSSRIQTEGTPKASAPPARREGSEAGRVQS